jgi:hypothetical protein
MSKPPTITENTKFEMILRSAMDFPGVRISREEFLRKELSKYYEDDVVNNAISTNPAQAGLRVEDLDNIAKSCINYETAKVTAISAGAGVFGFKAMAVTIPADTMQFFAHVVRMLQKLAYLYGWQEMFRDTEGGLDDETSNQLTIFVGVMFGVNAANKAITKIAGLMAQNVHKQLVRQTLTKGAIYPLVKRIARIIGMRMTIPIFAKGVGKIIPIVGAVTSGGITYAFFKPMSIRLKKYLADLPMASVDFYDRPKGEGYITDVDFTDIDLSDTEDEIDDGIDDN